MGEHSKGTASASSGDGQAPRQSTWLGESSEGRALRTMAAGYAAISLLSLVRVPWMGTLKLTEIPISLPWEAFWRVGFAVGMGAVCLAFVRLLAEDHAEDRLSGLFRAAIPIHLIAGVAIPLTSTDMFTNLAYGHMMWEGLDPYRVGPVALPDGDPFGALVPANWMDTTIAYGPPIAWMGWGLTATGEVVSSLIAHNIASVLIAIACVWLARAYCREALSGAARCRAFVLFALNPVFVWEISGQAHNDGVMVLAIMGFVLLAHRGHAWGALACLVAGLSSKFAALPILGLYLCHGLRSAPLRTSAMAGSLAILAAGLYITQGEAISAVLGTVSNQDVAPYRITNSLAYLVYWGFAPAGQSAQVAAFRVWSALAGLLLLGAALRAAWRARSLDDVFAESHLFMLLLLLLAPQFQPWYVCWLLPLSMTLCARPEGRLTTQFVALFSVLFVFQYPITGRLVGSFTIALLGATFVRLIQRGDTVPAARDALALPGALWRAR
jgi:hypothetical protein